MKESSKPAAQPLLLTLGPEFQLRLRHGEIITVLAALEFARRGIDPELAAEHYKRLGEVAEKIKRQRKETENNNA